MPDCLFCKIASGEIPSEKVYEDDMAVAFRDIQPEAPVHLVVIPKKHIATLNDLSDEDADVASAFLLACQRAARAEKVDKTGYRVVMNCNRDAGQLVFHFHAHVLGGRLMGWPPG